MRKSIDGLLAIVQQELQKDACSGHLFVFVSRRLAAALKHANDMLTPSDLEGWYQHCGYEALAQCA